MLSVWYNLIHLIFSQHPCINLGKLGYTKARFLSLSATDIVGQIILGCGGCPVHSRVFGGICPLHANGTFPSSDNQPMSPDTAKCLRVRSAKMPLTWGPVCSSIKQSPNLKGLNWHFFPCSCYKVYSVLGLSLPNVIVILCLHHQSSWQKVKETWQTTC